MVATNQYLFGFCAHKLSFCCYIFVVYFYQLVFGSQKLAFYQLCLVTNQYLEHTHQHFVAAVQYFVCKINILWPYFMFMLTNQSLLAKNQDFIDILWTTMFILCVQYSFCGHNCKLAFALWVGLLASSLISHHPFLYFLPRQLTAAYNSKLT